MNKHLVLIYQNVNIPFIFEEAEALGMRITLINRPDQPPVELPAVKKQFSLDIFNESEAIRELKKLHESDPIDGVMTLFDGAITFTSLVADKFNLPKPGGKSHLLLRDKQVMRDQFDSYNINNPRYTEIDDTNDINEIKSVEYPVVIKPKTGFSSLGVIRADNKQELQKGLQAVKDINEQTLNYMSVNEGKSFSGIIVEEYIDGPEYVAESFVNDGNVSVLSIGYKGEPKGPYFEEGVYIAPADLSKTLKEEIIEQVTKSNEALGILNGPTHTELRIGSDQHPYILEVGARIGGSGISHYIVKESTGINLAELSLRSITGEKVESPPKAPTPKKAAGNYIIPTMGDGEIASINGLDKILRKEETKRLIQFLNAGDIIEPYPKFSGYPGFVLTSHEDYSECADYYEWLEQEISITYK